MKNDENVLGEDVGGLSRDSHSRDGWNINNKKKQFLQLQDEVSYSRYIYLQE